jgi:hypothetical protein
MMTAILSGPLLCIISSEVDKRPCVRPTINRYSFLSFFVIMRMHLIVAVSGRHHRPVPAPTYIWLCSMHYACLISVIAKTFGTRKTAHIYGHFCLANVSFRTNVTIVSAMAYKINMIGLFLPVCTTCS